MRPCFIPQFTEKLISSKNENVYKMWIMWIIYWFNKFFTKKSMSIIRQLIYGRLSVHYWIMAKDNSHGLWTQLKDMHRRVRLFFTISLAERKSEEEKFSSVRFSVCRHDHEWTENLSVSELCNANYSTNSRFICNL